MTATPKIRIEQSYDDVTIWVDNRFYRFGNEDCSLGAETIATLLKDLNFNVEFYSAY